MLFVTSISGAFGGIVHGLYFDLDWFQIGRVSFFGVIITTFVIFPALLLFEYIFDLDNKAEMNNIRKRIDSLESLLGKEKDNR